MKRHRWLTPYIRRRHPDDRSESYRVCVQMSFYGPDCFVLVQRGVHPRLVMATAPSRRALIRSLVAVPASNGRQFRKWANSVGAISRGDP